jgi:hypothetical protein
MRRSLIIVSTAGAVLAAGLFAVPAIAATDTTGTCPVTGASIGTQGGAGAGMGRMGAGNGYGLGAGMGSGMGSQAGSGLGNGYGMGMGRSGGTVADPLAGLTQGSVTDAQKQALAGMAEEEKLAHDVYTALAKTTGDARFTRIATAETRHLSEVRALLTRYAITDPTAGKADGVFATASVRTQYTDLVARGSASLTAALAVGREIENADIADLAKAGTGVTAQDVQTVYTRLTNGSRMHLRAFGG